MDNPRPEKVAVVDEVRERLDGTSATILAEYRGLSVAKLAELRSSLRTAGGDFKVYKNTLVRFAARDLGLEIEDLLAGPTALAFVTDKPDGTPGDAVDVAKVLKDFGKENPALVVKGGMLGDKLLSADDTKALADVEPREVLLATSRRRHRCTDAEVRRSAPGDAPQHGVRPQGPHRPGRRTRRSGRSRACFRARRRRRRRGCASRGTGRRDHDADEAAPAAEAARRHPRPTTDQRTRRCGRPRRSRRH